MKSDLIGEVLGKGIPRKRSVFGGLASPAGFGPTAFRLGAQIMVVLMDYLFHDFRSEKHDYYRHVGLFCIPRMILFHDLLRNRSKKVVVNL